MTDWVAMCRLCVADIRDVLDLLPTRLEREPVLRRGQGGDDTTAIDQAAEFFGYVYDFGTGEEWTAERGTGAFLQGEPLGPVTPKDRIEILSFEGTTASAIAERIPSVLGLVDRVRVMGSLALSLCQLADGRVDAVCSLKEARSVDIAAAQLLVRERGLAIELFEDPPFGSARLDLVTRSRVAAAASPELVDALSGALR